MENRQIAITEFGGVKNLVLQTSVIPGPKAGEVVVKVSFSGVNPIDVKTRAGLGWAAAQNKDNLPWVPGYDIAGQVVTLGEQAVLLLVIMWRALSVSHCKAVAIANMCVYLKLR